MTFRTKLIKILQQPKSLLGGKKANDFHEFLSCSKYLNNIKTFIDIGAHEGSFIDACLKFYPNAIVYAFEPTPNNAEKISKEFPKINVFNFGLWNENASEPPYAKSIGHH